MIIIIEMILNENFFKINCLFQFNSKKKKIKIDSFFFFHPLFSFIIILHKSAKTAETHNTTISN